MRTIFLLTFFALASSFISGCTTTRFLQDAEGVKELRGIAVVVNATMHMDEPLSPMP